MNYPRGSNWCVVAAAGAAGAGAGASASAGAVEQEDAHDRW